MTREDLENLVIEATGRSDKLSLIRQAINIAVEEVSSQQLWSDLQVEGLGTLTANVGYLALPSTMSRLTEVRLIDDTLSRPLMIRPKTWLISRCPSPESRSTSRPVYGYLEGQTLYVIPIPNQNYTIRYTYFRLHPQLALASSPVLIRHAGPAVAAYATFWVFQTIEKAKDAETWLTSYFKLLESATKVDKANSAIRQEATPRTGDQPMDTQDYWLDPFVKGMP